VSGRPFHREELALPIEKLSMRGVQFNQDGLEKVRAHMSRFEPYDGNDRMLARLEEVVSGQRLPQDVDVRFYTHELRELERYTAAGWPTGVPQDVEEAHRLWNNEHTATLEEYGVNPLTDSLYVSE
jgi:hypothetical protein